MVIYKCRELNNPVTETLAAYVAQTTLNESKSPLSQLFVSTICLNYLNSSFIYVFCLLFAGTGQFYLENQISETEAEQLVSLTIDRLSQIDSPSLNTIKLQIGYDSAYVKQEV